MNETAARLKPLGPLGSLLYFGIPSAIFSASILGLLPWMIRHGYSQLFTYLVTFSLPLFLMLVAAFVFYRLEGRPWRWAPFRDRMRLQQPTGGDWRWTVGLVAVTTVGSLAIRPVARLLAGVRFYEHPPEFIAVMSGVANGTFGGMAMQGRWDIFLLAVLLLLLNIAAEELWWRGLILPRQELAFGKWAWLVNGVLWDLFHFFYHPNLGSVVAFLVPTLSLAFVAQRTRNTWPGIVAHLITNRSDLIAPFRTIT